MKSEHRTYIAGYTADADEVWKCLLCSWQAQYGKGGFLLLDAGDPNAWHSGPVGRLATEARIVSSNSTNAPEWEQDEEPWWTKAGIEAWLARGGGE